MRKFIDKLKRELTQAKRTDRNFCLEVRPVSVQMSLDASAHSFWVSHFHDIPKIIRDQDTNYPEVL